MVYASVVTFVAEVYGTVQSFDAEMYRSRLASMLEGIALSDITLEVTGGSVIVSSRIVADASTARTVTTMLLNPAHNSTSALSAALGVAVLRAYSPTVSVEPVVASVRPPPATSSAPLPSPPSPALIINDTTMPSTALAINDTTSSALSSSDSGNGDDGDVDGVTIVVYILVGVLAFFALLLCVLARMMMRWRIEFRRGDDRTKIVQHGNQSDLIMDYGSPIGGQGGDSSSETPRAVALLSTSVVDVQVERSNSIRSRQVEERTSKVK